MPNISKSYYLDGGKLRDIILSSKMSWDEVAKVSLLHRNTLDNYIFYAQTIGEGVAHRLAEMFKVDVMDFCSINDGSLCDYTKALKDDTSEESYSYIEQGIKTNIRKRLSVGHSPLFVNELMTLVSDLICESEYYGVEKCKRGEEKEIVEKIQQKRRYR